MASGKTDELKGRVKEAAGALTGDDKLKREGKTDQVVGKIKQQAEKVIEKVKDTHQVLTRGPRPTRSIGGSQARSSPHRG